MFHRATTARSSVRLAAVVGAVISLVGGMVVAAPAQAAPIRTISGSFTIPASGIESWWAETVYITAYDAEGNWAGSASVNAAAKTFSVSSLEPGVYSLHFSTSTVDHDGDGHYESANLVGQDYSSSTTVDVTAANATGVTYAFTAGKTVSGTVSLGAGTTASWRGDVVASVSIPGPEGCECGDALTAAVNPTTGAYVIRGLPNKSLTVYFAADYGSTANLIPEFWNNAATYAEATKLDFSTGNKTNINATLELGRTISGTVSLPPGVDAKALDAINVRSFASNGVQGWAEVNPTTGAYVLRGLAPGSHAVKFEAGDWYDDSFNLVKTPLSSIFFSGAYTQASATLINVTSANATGKSQLMEIGRTVSGTVTLGAGLDAAWYGYLAVYAETDDGAFRSAKVDPTTHTYTIQGLAPGSYTISFETTGRNVAGEWTYANTQYEYWDNKRSPYAADPVVVSSADVTGINATLDLQVGDRTFWVTPTPTIAGSTTFGSTLTASPGTWEPYGAEFAYQWKRNGANIPSATASTYVLAAADGGANITVAVTGAQEGFTSVTKTSAALAVPLASFAAAPVPTISGTFGFGQTLTASTGTWSPVPSFTYQWTRNGTNIAGATAATYALTADDVGATVGVKVTGTATGYSQTTRTAPGSTVAAATFTAAPTPTVSGTLIPGNTLTAATGTWTPAPSFSYQWVRGVYEIPGATNPTYTLTMDDVQGPIAVRVTATRTGYAETVKTSANQFVDYGHFTNSAAPVLSGTAEVGQVLSVTTGGWDPAPTGYVYRWVRDGQYISGALASTYTLQAADAGTEISAEVTATKFGYQGASETTGAVEVQGAAFASTPTPTISGTTTVGATLTAQIPAWSPTVDSYAYRWLRDGEAISGATATTYTLVAADFDHAISFEATGTKFGYSRTTVTSAPTELVSGLAFTASPIPSISGTPAPGATLTAVTGTWSPTPTFSYQWFVDGEAIDSATGKTYRPTATQVGRSITVEVTANKTGYAPTFKTSAAKTVRFRDVSAATYGSSAISWFAQQGITGGYSDGTFRPTDNVQRGHMAQFLYRLEDEPAVTLPGTSPFKDVSTSSSIYPAVVWLASEGISTGYGGGKFAPTRSVSRKEMAMFLYRLAGSPTVTLPSTSPFPDVPVTDSGYQAIVWAAQSDITKGYANGTFKPGSPIIRSHMALFLQRYDAIG